MRSAVRPAITPIAIMAGGFCFLNNSAIAAAHLRLQHERVAILDVDVHHGNGTQGIFYERADVLTVSIHADPAHFYPFVWGYAHERGAGPGLGANLNIPLPIGTNDDGYVAGARRRAENDPVPLHRPRWSSRSVSMRRSMIRSPALP